MNINRAVVSLTTLAVLCVGTQGVHATGAGVGLDTASASSDRTLSLATADDWPWEGPQAPAAAGDDWPWEEPLPR
jgi:hypothetical protein